MCMSDIHLKNVFLFFVVSENEQRNYTVFKKIYDTYTPFLY